MSGEPGGLSASIRRQLAEGRSNDDIVTDLVAGGLSRASAQRFVDREIAAMPAPAPQPPAVPQEPAQIWQGDTPEEVAPLPPPVVRLPPRRAFRTLNPKTARMVIVGAMLVGLFTLIGTFQARRKAASDQALQALLDEIDGPRRVMPRTAEQIAQELEYGERSLASNDDSSRCTGAAIIGEHGSDRHMADLMDILNSSTSVNVQECMASALVKLGYIDRPLTLYAEWANSDRRGLQMMAFRGFAAVGPDAGELAFTHLNRALADESHYIRLAAVDALAQLGPDAEPYLQVAVRDADRGVRAKALEAIKKLNAAPR
jgi:hypothetical protein